MESPYIARDRRAAAPGAPRVDGAWKVLNAATAARHAQVESLPLMSALMSPAVDRGTCVEVLRRMWRVHAGWESANGPRLRALPWTWRPRAPQLAADLQALGEHPADPPPVSPVAAGDAEAWGMLYVVEGSALGGQLIARHLRRHLPAVGAVVRHFDGPGPGPGWREFRATLEEALPGAGARIRAASAAQAIFGHFHAQLGMPLAAGERTGTVTA